MFAPSIWNITAVPSKWPHFNRPYLVTVCKRKLVAITKCNEIPLLLVAWLKDCESFSFSNMEGPYALAQSPPIMAEVADFFLRTPILKATSNFAVLWPTDFIFTAIKDLNLLKEQIKNQEAGSIFKVFLLSQSDLIFIGLI